MTIIQIAGTTSLTLLNGLEDGTFIIGRDGDTVLDYAARWSYGYIVGIRPLTAEDIQPYQKFGVWHHKGVTHIDVVEHVSDRYEAFALAKRHNQIAVWDLREKKEVYV